MTAPRANSPTSPATRDRIAVDAVSTDAIDRLHAEADRTGLSVSKVAAAWLDGYHPPTRRVVAVVWNAGSPLWFAHGEGFMDWQDVGPIPALAHASRFHPNARIEDAGPGRYELVEDA